MFRLTNVIPERIIFVNRGITVSGTRDKHAFLANGRISLAVLLPYAQKRVSFKMYRAESAR
jgi:hypothetical protein